MLVSRVTSRPKYVSYSAKHGVQRAALRLLGLQPTYSDHYHARMARRAQHLRCYVREANERTTSWITLTRALRARRARPPEVPEKAPYLAALQPLAGLRAPLSSLRLSRSCCKQVEPGGTRQCSRARSVRKHLVR